MLATLQGVFEDPILILEIVSTVIGAFVIVTIFNRLIGRIEKRGELEKGKLVHLRRFFQIIIYLVAGIIVLSLLDVNITGAIAGLGVGALVIGFGLSDIIENWVSGVLIMSGKTFAIGDVIRVGTLTGTVTDIALRTTKLTTYDRNEIIIPNAVLIKEKIINLTGGKKEAVAELTFAIDYTADAEKAKSIIETILKNHKSVIFNLKKKREIRFIFRNKEWTNEIETLFWINEPSNEEFIKSNITELIQKAFKNECILPPIPSLMRREYLTGQKTPNDQQTE
ncbi:MAG: mechanosensitive ion channel family protein [Candidatus Bathyarchaeota archaeon]|nr:mechanosensitive ion channel family protein [Candidatus Bathyarchaeum sp.]